VTRHVWILLASSAGPLLFTLLALDAGHAWLVRPASDTPLETASLIALALVALSVLVSALLAAEALTVAIYRGIDRWVSRWGSLFTPAILSILASPLLWVLARQPFVGNRYKDTPLALYGPWVVLAVLVVASAAGVWVGARLLVWIVEDRTRRPALRRMTLLMVAGLCAAVVAIDALWYAGWYPLVHTVMSAAAAVLVHVLILVFASTSGRTQAWCQRCSLSAIVLVAVAALGVWLGATQTTAWRVATGTLFSARVANPVLLFRSRPLDIGELARLKGAGPADLAVAPGNRATPPAIASSGLLVTVDTLRADAVGAGVAGSLTPEIDRFFAPGARFTRAYSQYASTRYSVTSILDSQFRDDGQPITDDLISRLRDFGFGIYAVLPTDVKLFVNVDRYHFDGITFYDDPVTVPDALRALTGNVAAEKRFVWVHLYQPHDPYEPPADLRRGGSARDGYNGEVAWVDRMFATVIEQLHADSGFVVLGADHGEEFREHGGTLHGRTGYDETLRVPLAVRGPGVAPASRGDLVANVDIAPTVLAAFGIPVPDRYQGYDLLGRASNAPADRTVYAETVTNAVVALQAQRKWIHSTDHDLWESYDLARDPRELRNDADDPRAMARGRVLIGAFEWPWRTLTGLRRMGSADYEQWLNRAVRPDTSVGELARLALYRAAASRVESEPVRALLARGLATEPKPLIKAELVRSLGPHRPRQPLALGGEPTDTATWLAVLKDADAYLEAPALIAGGRRHAVAAVRALASEQYARRNPEAAAVLIDAGGIDVASRRGLVVGLAAQAKAVPPDVFRRRLDDADVDVRIAAINGLAGTAAEDATETLKQRSESERSPSVLAAVLGRLLERDRPSGVAALRREIEHPRLSNTVRVQLIGQWQVAEARQHLVDLFAATDTGGFRTLLFETASKLPLSRATTISLLEQMRRQAFEPGLRARIDARLRALRSDPAGDDHHEPGVSGQ
jgi:hypothetical protein